MKPAAHKVVAEIDNISHLLELRRLYEPGHEMHAVIDARIDELCGKAPRRPTIDPRATKSGAAGPTPPMPEIGAHRAREQTFRLPLPPTVNQYWRHVSPGKRRDPRRVVVKSADGRRFTRAARDMARQQGVVPVEGEVEVRLVFYFNRRGCDTDNRIKPALDSLEGVAYKNDRQVARIVADRALDPSNPRTEVTVRLMEQGADSEKAA